MELGSQLKKAREDRKLSQQEVAHLLDVSQKTLSNFESGKTVPNILQIAKLGVIYGLDMIKLLEKSGIFLAPLSSPLSKSNPITQPRD
ncbi:helix-turn-helix domain-containing protein [Algoriphagus faecimaris]|uniref:helix-turn-helix domain-containing protein n=1 Tax=Algoriphagus faecimaris TaxID=686796 RepID=UPI000B434470|nr:helix-turn-helix transcriptional regulator [Algoriphagus faecimaris]